jgi:hypothetical protein
MQTTQPLRIDSPGERRGDPTLMLLIGVADPSSDGDALRAEVARLEAVVGRMTEDLARERVEHGAFRILTGVLLDAVAERYDLSDQSPIPDQDGLDELYREALHAAAKRLGTPEVLYGGAAERAVRRNRDAMGREDRCRRARASIIELEREVVDLRAEAAEMRERAWRDAAAPIVRAGLWQRRYLGVAYADRRTAEIARTRHLARLAAARTALLDRCDALERQAARLDAIAKGWVPDRQIGLSDTKGWAIAAE